MDKFSATAIIPIFNEADNIKKIIKCAENQTIPFNKIIIINDGSDDKSLSKILKYKRTNKIKIINNKVNLGINKSLNLALKFVKTKFFFIMSAGDIYSLNVLKWCKDIYDKNKDVGMICGNVEILNASYNKKIIRELPFKKNIVLYQCDFVKVAKKRNVTFFGGGVLMKTKNVLKIGGYPMDLKWIADWYLYLILGMNFPFICVDKVFSTLTLRKNDYSKSLFDWKKNKIVLKNFFNLINSQNKQIFQVFKSSGILPIYEFKVFLLIFTDKNLRNYLSFLLLWRLISYKICKYLSFCVPQKYHNEIRVKFRI